MHLLSLIAVASSLVSGFPVGPANEFHTLVLNDGPGVLGIEIAFGRGEGNVAVPVRFTGAGVGVDVRVCDSKACLTPEIVHVPARGVVEVEAPPGDDGLPNIEVVGSVGDYPVQCCQRSTPVSVRTAAIVGPELEPAADVRGASNGSAVELVAVGFLFDERLDQLANVGAVVLRDDDDDEGHGEAFWVGLRRFVLLGGLVSMPKSLAPHLGLPAMASSSMVAATASDAAPIELQTRGHRLASMIALGEGDHVVVNGTIHRLGSGVVVVRTPGVAIVDAVADLVRAEPAFTTSRPSRWRHGSTLVDSALVALQPSTSAGSAAVLVLGCGGLALLGAVLVRRRRQPLSIAQTAAVVTTILGLSGTVLVVAAVATSSWRTASVRVIGPGTVLRTETLVMMRSPDASIAATAFVADERLGARRFVVGRRARHNGAAALGAEVGQLQITESVVDVDGVLFSSEEMVTSTFKHPLLVRKLDQTDSIVAAGGSLEQFSVGAAMPQIPLHITRLMTDFRNDCRCAVGWFVDDAGTDTLVIGTKQ